MSDKLIQALQNPKIFPHPIFKFEVIQTHLSWIILTGKFAYKIKKPLNLGFQDFTTLEKRKYYCDLEIVLNQSLASELYLDVVMITGSITHPTINESGRAIEYAIKMHQFPQEDLLLRLAIQKKLTGDTIKDIAYQLATFHQSAPYDQKSIFGSPEEVFLPMQENFKTVKQLDLIPLADSINALEASTYAFYQELKPILEKRKAKGFIKACHGDLHLGNIVMFQGKPLIFDCIEFNEHLRWTDVMNDVAFLAMDLDHLKLTEFKHLFINHYLAHTNDYEGILLLKFYQCYRAMVRTKITYLQAKQQNQNINSEFYKTMVNYIDIAMQYTYTPYPRLILTFGPSGSGKTTYTEALLQKTGAIRLSSDFIRKHLYHLAPYQTTSLPLQKVIYSPDATKKLYNELARLSKIILNAGYSVIIDATCLKVWQRSLFLNLGKELNVPCEILAFEFSTDILQNRILERITQKKDASEANISVLKEQLQAIEPLTIYEKESATIISPTHLK